MKTATPVPNDCIFCEILKARSELKEKSQVLFTTKHFFMIFPIKPIRRGHLLIISKRHHRDSFTLDPIEWSDLQRAVKKSKTFLDRTFAPDAYNLWVNCGAEAGQTVFHLHFHFVPRHKGDTAI